MLKKLLLIVILLCANIAWAATEINKANAAELEAIKGIGPAMSQRILTERGKGNFKDWTDLQARVKGIKAKKSAKLSEAGLTINGSSFNGAAIAPANTVQHKTKAAKASATTSKN